MGSVTPTAFAAAAAACSKRAARQASRAEHPKHCRGTHALGQGWLPAEEAICDAVILHRGEGSGRHLRGAPDAAGSETVKGTCSGMPPVQRPAFAIGSDCPPNGALYTDLPLNGPGRGPINQGCPPSCRPRFHSRRGQQSSGARYINNQTCPVNEGSAGQRLPGSIPGLGPRVGSAAAPALTSVTPKELHWPCK